MQPNNYPQDATYYPQQPYPQQPYPQQPYPGFPDQQNQYMSGYPQAAYYPYNPDQPVYVAQEPPTYAPQVPEKLPQTYAPQPQVIQQMPQTNYPRNVHRPSPAAFGEYPIQVTCPNCYREVTTIVNSSPGFGVLGMFLVLCCISPLCSFIPFLIPSLYNKTHVCPKCNFTLGRRSI
mmetsp:Transcript_2895/g.4500  ORF Transcript_2895/g.4500 Transcript_2895/m.4500 type:complete len:176 (+) Transcript_2895:40-567(+)